MLNIGAGAGTEALLLSHSGANCIAMDITSQAAAAAESLIRKVGGKGLGVQADARFIPVGDSTVDVVCSSGGYCTTRPTWRARLLKSIGF
ncbi:MAG: methyltransferase domain-containing protein [Lewinellaceae bacterium]|nr:methyltransferase domain-containing protein [Lewinellaceae bacterium]